MAEQMPSKRQREETQNPDEETKRHKSYNHILSLLDAEEDELNPDLSSLITTLQHELSSDSVFDYPLPCPTTTLQSSDKGNSRDISAITEATTNTISSSLEDYTWETFPLKGDDDKEQVIRHLLEVSDDELGIPNREDGDEKGFNNGGNGLALCDRLWELEDEAANYYTLLQSELFL